MFAPYVELQLMARKPVLLESLFPVSTPLKADRWECALRDARVLDKFSEVPKGLRTGFDIGWNSLCFCRNPFRLAFIIVPRGPHEFIVSKYTLEIALGRVSPGFLPATAECLFGPYRTAPLNVITSSGGKQLRITLDLSYSRDDPSVSSVNTYINSDNFPCDWGTFSACWLLVPKLKDYLESCGISHWYSQSCLSDSACWSCPFTIFFRVPRSFPFRRF